MRSIRGGGIQSFLEDPIVEMQPAESLSLMKYLSLFGKPCWPFSLPGGNIKVLGMME